MSSQAVRFVHGDVDGWLERPLQPAGEGLVLTHGAGGNCQSALLVAVGRAFSEAGLTVLRVNLPFRQKRPFGPPSPASAAADRAGLKTALATLREVVPGRIFLGGQSYGGRQASLLVAEDPSAAAGLLLLSYPLHPPGKPGQARTAHFGSIGLPALFVHGSRDPFGSLDEVRAALTLIPARTTLIPVDGAAHDLKRGDFDVAKLVVAPFRTLLSADKNLTNP